VRAHDAQLLDTPRIHAISYEQMRSRGDAGRGYMMISPVQRSMHPTHGRIIGTHLLAGGTLSTLLARIGRR
jgi:hypothetical protein